MGEDERPVVLHVAGPALDDPLGVAQLFIENVQLTSIASFRMAEPAVLHRRAGRPARGYFVTPAHHVSVVRDLVLPAGVTVEVVAASE